jgi:hypothetical protein
VPWARFRWAEAHIHFARAVGAARTGKTDLARNEIAALDEIRKSLPPRPGEYDWGKQVEIHQRIAAAWLAWADGQKERSVELMRAAAELDDATEKHPVTPGSILPAREQLGELLLVSNRPAEALVEYKISLGRAPGRIAGLHGAALAAELTGDQVEARRYRSLLPLCGKGCARGELALATSPRGKAP